VRSGSEPKDEEVADSASAAFLLYVLVSSGIAAPLVPREDAFAVHVLKRAMEAGDLGAQLALAERLFEGRDVERDCSEGMRQASCGLSENTMPIMWWRHC
jgi:TPR repeat protein